MPEDYALNLEEMKRMMANARGTNLAGQSMQTDPTYSSGFDYARSIAGGMPMEQIIAPGVSYSPEMAGGYTQKDLDMIAAGPAPVMPIAPTTGEVATIEDQMEFAPPGVSEPTKFIPFLQNLDFSNLPRYEDIRDIRGVEDITPTLFDFDVQEILKDVDTLKNIDAEALQDIALTGIDIPAIPQVPGMPTAPVFKEPIPFVPEVQNIPMNFTGLPQMPVIPNIPAIPELPVMPQSIVPQPIQPMNFTRLSDLPVSNFVQPSVDEIVRPITRQGKFLPQAPRGLFSL